MTAIEHIARRLLATLDAGGDPTEEVAALREAFESSPIAKLERQVAVLHEQLALRNAELQRLGEVATAMSATYYQQELAWKARFAELSKT